MKTKPCSEIEIVQHAKTDLEAFGDLVERYRGSITRQCFSRVRDHQHAEDLAQETFVRAWLKLKQLREPHMFANWLRKIASNVCNEFARGSARQECPWETVPEEAALDAYVFSTSSLLDTLPEQSRICIDLHYHEGFSYSEIASVLGISPVTVRNRLHRSKQMLKKEMADMTPVERSAFTQMVIDKLEQLESHIPKDREQAAIDLRRGLEEDKHSKILEHLRGNFDQDNPHCEPLRTIDRAIKDSRKHQSPEMRDALIDIIQHSEYEELRLRAAGAIVAQRDPTAVPFLEQGLNDSWNPKEVIAALKSSITQLRYMEIPVVTYERIYLHRDVKKAAGDKKTRLEFMKKLVAALEDPSQKVRNQALKALGDLGDKRAVPAITKLLDEPGTRQAAVLVLGKLGSKRAVPAIIRLLESESDPMTLQAVVKSLSLLRDSSAVPTVIDMLKRTNARGPALLFISLNYFVEAATNDDIPSIDNLLSSLKPNFNRMSEGISRHRNWILANHGDERYLPDLIEAAKADSYDGVLVDGIWRIMGDESFDIMKMLLLDYANETAACHLLDMGKQGFDVISEAMRSEKWQVREKACRAMRFTRDKVLKNKFINKEAIDLMQQIADHDPASLVRFYAKAFLQRMHQAQRNG